VLATSRETLGVAGEAPWPMPCLSLPPAGAARPEDLARSDAVSLFSSRAGVAQPGFGVTWANADAITQICRRLDGIPLALELAAARIRALGAHQLGRHLDDRFRLLSGGGRTAVPRHQTLRAAMDWSFELLTAAEQLLLRRLSVFPQSFTLDAAEVVGGNQEHTAGSSTVDLLVRLVDKSLVEDDGESIRYHLLETVRQYGAEKLAEAGEAHETHRRHRDLFVTLAEERALFEWSGGRAEPLADEAITAARSVPFRGILVMTLVRGTQAAVLSGRHRRAAALLRELLGLLHELGARRWIADTLEATVLVLEAVGRPEAAARLLDASDSLRQALGEPPTALPALAASLDACRTHIGK
ncbi:MAG: ATP-binding protein, partial [Candidatus Rokuibacteriota bacterium]